MPTPPENSSASGDDPSTQAERLIQAYLAQMAESGIAGATASAVAARAGTSVAAVELHFDSIERLCGLAQQRAIAEARPWLVARMAEADRGAPWTPAAFPAFAASVIDDWCNDHRILAQAEACDTAALAWRVSDAAGQWISLWEGFWTAALPRFSLPIDLAPVAAAILQSERFGHLARWRVPYDRAGLEEVCTRLAARLSGDAELLARPAPWRAMAESLSLQAAIFPPLDGPSALVARAVVAAVDEAGEDALSHAAAAAESGLPLEAVTHHFPTRAALMAAGYGWLYQSILDATERTEALDDGHGDLARHILTLVDIAPSLPRARAFETFFFSATRDPALADFAARVRYSRGVSTLAFLGSAAAGLTRLDGVLLSHWICGFARRAAADPERAIELRRALPGQASLLFPPEPREDRSPEA